MPASCGGRDPRRPSVGRLPDHPAGPEAHRLVDHRETAFGQKLFFPPAIDAFGHQIGALGLSQTFEQGIAVVLTDQITQIKQIGNTTLMLQISLDLFVKIEVPGDQKRAQRSISAHTRLASSTFGVLKRLNRQRIPGKPASTIALQVLLTS